MECHGRRGDEIEEIFAYRDRIEVRNKDLANIVSSTIAGKGFGPEGDYKSKTTFYHAVYCRLTTKTKAEDAYLQIDGGGPSPRAALETSITTKQGCLINVV